MLEVTENEIKNRLAFDNPWWEEGQVHQRFRDWPRRAYFDAFYRLIAETSARRAIVLMGPRRVGKTVMLSQAAQALIDSGIAPIRILYVSVDTPAYTGLPLERLTNLFRALHGHERDVRLWVFFDEIQYHADWERHLKSLVDSFPETRFVASGSAAAALKLKSDESGAGRFTDFLLPPLNFAEFLQFKKTGDLVRERETDGRKRVELTDIEALNDAFVEYVNYGGFPEAVLDPSVRDEMDRYVANDIVDKVLLRDLPSLYGIADTQELKRFFTVVAYNTGSEVSFEGLSKASGVAKNTIRKYLDYLEAAFLIHRLFRLDQQGKRFRRVTHFKVYLTNPSIRCALFGPVRAEDQAMGQCAETAVFAQFAQTAFAQHLSYARWKDGEVDLVHVARDQSMTAMEIKWSDRAVRNPREELRALRRFAGNTGLKKVWVYTRALRQDISVNDLELIFVPMSVFCYQVARYNVVDALKVGEDPRTFRPFLMEGNDEEPGGRA